MFDKVCWFHPQYFGNVVNFPVLYFAVFGFFKVLWGYAAFSLVPLVILELRPENGQEHLDDLVRISLAVLLDKLSNLIDIDLLEALNLALLLLDIRFVLIDVYRVKFLLQERGTVRALPLILQLSSTLVLRHLEVLLLFLLGCVLVLASALLR